MSERKAIALGLKPKATICNIQVSGIKPQIMGLGPVIAVKKMLERSGLTMAEIDQIEFNEAFASQTIACIDELGIEHSKINPNGGSLAIGHPLGATGIRLVGTLANSLAKDNKRYGIATQCIGAGMGIATLLEKY
jgi:acetyl-CoA acetyltransferase